MSATRQLERGPTLAVWRVAVALLALLYMDAGRALAGERVVTIVATAELKGVTEPCGCTSDPLGDVARLATVAKGALLVDAGSLLYDPLAERRAQADETAVALQTIFTKLGAELGLGWGDLVHGATAVRVPHLASNVKAPYVKAPIVRTVSGVKVGVFAVVDPERLPGIDAAPPVETAKAAAAVLHKQGAEVVVALLGMNRQKSRALLRQVTGIDIGVAGADVGEGSADAEQIGSALLVASADQGRRAAKIALHLRGDGSFAIYLDGEARTRRGADAKRKADFLRGQLTGWEKDPKADPAFLAQKRQDIDEADAEAKKMLAPAPAPPATNYAIYALVAIRKNIARDPEIVRALDALEKRIGLVNLAAAKQEPLPKLSNDQPHFVGRAACEHCHKPETAFWKTTVHAHAWATLVDVKKQYNYNCVSCHVAGFREPGGSNLATVEKARLTDVQCEVCHGPASIHVAEKGLEDPKTLVNNPPETFCRSKCHTPEHSDTFQYVPYLRDILGRGHGEKLRAALGEGVTGHELRGAALKTAAHE